VTPESIERGREIAESMMDRATAEYHSTLDAGAPREAAQPLSSAPGTVQESTDRGTGEPKAQDSRQAIDDLNSKHWLKWNTIARTITGCQCGFRADVDSDCGFGDSVVAHLLEVGAADSRPGHYREAANSLRGYAAGRHVGDTYDSGFTDGITAAADRVDSYARDLDEEAGR